MLGTHVDELNVEPVDRRYELRQRIQFRLRLLPVVVRTPILYERLELRQLHSLGKIIDGFSFGPARRRDAPTEIEELLLGMPMWKGRTKLGSDAASGGTRLNAPMAAELARKPRRVDSACMILFLTNSSFVAAQCQSPRCRYGLISDTRAVPALLSDCSLLFPNCQMAANTPRMGRGPRAFG
jgi:hypothetical protein